MKRIIKKLQELRKADVNLFALVFNYLYYRIRYKLTIYACQRVQIKNPANIIQDEDSSLWIGMDYIGFSSKHDRTILNIQGTCCLFGNVSIRRGARIDVCEYGTLYIRNNVVISCFTRIIARHYIVIGKNTSISWDCQLMDDDFHEITYEGKKTKKHLGIVIGNHCLIGNKTSIYKSVTIPDGTIVASNSVIKKSIDTVNCMIGSDGIIKTNVSWK